MSARHRQRVVLVVAPLAVRAAHSERLSCALQARTERVEVEEEEAVAAAQVMKRIERQHTAEQTQKDSNHHHPLLS
jgi:hypothetical protein